MKHSLILFAAIALSSSLASADVKSDILALTGNGRTRLTWVRWPWCDSSYNPIQAYKYPLGDNLGFEQEHALTQLMCFDTDSGKYQFIDSTIGYHLFPRITRKNGNYVIWTDAAGKCSWIRDIGRTAPKRKLLDGGDYAVVACQYNTATDSEFVYVFVKYPIGNNYFFSMTAGKGIVRIPLKNDYTPDLTKKDTIIMRAPDPPVFDPETYSPEVIMYFVNLSQDGKYLGCALGIPDCNMLETATGKLIARHDATQEYGCQTNIAPDNSYRFYHLGDSHTQLSMFDAGVAPTVKMWYCEIMSKMPGSTYSGNNCLEPRWTNDVRYFTNAYPLETGLFGLSDNIFNHDAAWVRGANASRAGSFCLAKFNAGFTAVEGAVRVTDGDVRHREAVGDAFIGLGTTSVQRAVSSQRGLSGPVVKGGMIVVGRPSTVLISDASGRIIRSCVVKANSMLDMRNLRAGVYAARIADERGWFAARLVVN